jgi:hypothetical protein
MKSISAEQPDDLPDPDQHEEYEGNGEKNVDRFGEERV